MLNIKINGENFNFKQGSNIQDIIDHLQIDSKKIAIEKNLEIIPKSLYSSTFLSENDNLEIVHFIGGG